MKRALGVAVVLILAAGIGIVVKNQQGLSSADMASPGYHESASEGGPMMGPAPMPSPASRTSAGFGKFTEVLGQQSDGVVAGEDIAVDAGGGGLALGAPDELVGEGPRVVKTAVIEIRLDKGRFEKSYQDASLVATRHAGFIQSSSVSKGEEFRSGTLIIRVPATDFDRALADFRKLGDVVGEEASGEDVTAQYVDLKSRLRHWEAQETVLLGLMAKATTIDESIKVQRNLQDVQLNIERLRGQLRLLSDQTDMGTITLTLAEGDAIAQLQNRKEEGTLAKAWRDAVGGFLAVIAATVVGLGYLIPIMLLILIAWLLYRRLRPVAAPSES